MGSLDRDVARASRSVITRAEILALGGTDRMISARLRSGIWIGAHPGVYKWGPRTGQWLERLELALAAAGPTAVVSHRAAVRLWGLEGIDTNLVEITVPFGQLPVPDGVIVHRTRRVLPRKIVHGVAVTSVERSLLDIAPMVPSAVLAKAMESAIRQDMTSVWSLELAAAEQGGRGVRGTGAFHRSIAQIVDLGVSGSPAEKEAILALRKWDVPDPVLQWEIATPSGRVYHVDFGWPDRMKAVEIDGLGAHTGGDRLEQDLIRQNDLLEAGVELRRFTGRQVRRSPKTFAEQVRRFLMG